MFQRPHHSLNGNEVHVWHLLTDHVDPSVTAGAIPSLLSADEQKRLGCYRKSRDQQLYALSRCVMRSVLASYLDCRGEALSFSANAFGKPVVQTNGGSLPLHFNLSHSHGAIALAVSRSREVGVDVEERGRRVEFLALAERFFAAAEARHLQQLEEEHRAAAFFAIWTLKEAFVKGIGRGLSFPLDAFCFELEGNRLIRFRPLQAFVSPHWHFAQFDLSDRHCGAVAVEKVDPGEVKIFMRDWRTTFLP